MVEHNYDIVLFTTLQFPLIISVARPCMPTAWIRPHKHGIRTSYCMSAITSTLHDEVPIYHAGIVVSAIYYILA